MQFLVIFTEFRRNSDVWFNCCLELFWISFLELHDFFCRAVLIFFQWAVKQRYHQRQQIIPTLSGASALLFIFASSSLENDFGMYWKKLISNHSRKSSSCKIISTLIYNFPVSRFHFCSESKFILEVISWRYSNTIIGGWVVFSLLAPNVALGW